MKTILTALLLAVLFCGRVSAEDPLYVHVPWDCKWTDDPPCIVIPVGNSNKLNDQISPTFSLSKIEIQKHNLIDFASVMEFVQGVEVSQSGPTGQSASVFMRGTDSNHTLVMINGIPINDSSTPTGAHDFGQDFMFGVQQVDVYKGSAGAHFGADAIGGAVNFRTTVDYENKIDIDPNSTSGNYYFRTDNNWDISVSGGVYEQETQSALAGGNELDSVKNQTVGFNASRWLDHNNNIYTNILTRNTRADIDGHSLAIEHGKWSDNTFYVMQAGYVNHNVLGTSSFVLHTHAYDRTYDDAEYTSESYTVRAEHKKDSWGIGIDYKHDASSADSLWDTSSTVLNNLGVFANATYDIFSLHYRHDQNYDSYKIGFLQPVTDSLTVRGSHSTGYKNSTRYTDTETSHTQEISVDYNNYSATLFQSDIGDLNTQGIELSYTHDGLRLYASHLDSTKNSTQQLRRPNLSVGALYTHELNDEWTVNTSYNYKGSHLDINNTDYTTVSMPDRHLVDLGVTRQVGKLAFTVSADNLLNEQYQSPHGFSQQGRTLSVSLGLKF